MGRRSKGGINDPTVSITVRLPMSKKQRLIQISKECGYADLSTYLLKVLDEYTVEIKLKKLSEDKKK